MTNVVTPLPPISPAPPIAAPQLSPENVAQLHAARSAMAKIRRAASIASFDGWTIGVFGALTLLVGLTDPTSIIMGLGLLAVAFVELRFGARLRQLEPGAARALGWNQIALGSLLVAYAAWRLTAVLHGRGGGGGGEYADIIGSDPQLARMLEPVEGLTRLVMTAVYTTLIGVGLLGQGSLALYYFTRQAHVRTYLVQTPPWIIEMQRAGMSL